MGNGTIGSMELCMKELQVRKSPAFFIFRRGGEKLAQWNGTSVQTFQDELNRCLELVASHGWVSCSWPRNLKSFHKQADWIWLELLLLLPLPLLLLPFAYASAAADTFSFSLFLGQQAMSL